MKKPFIVIQAKQPKAKIRKNASIPKPLASRWFIIDIPSPEKLVRGLDDQKTF